MPKVRRTSQSDDIMPRQKPALTAEARENQMIALAVNLAEKQLREGTASSQVITHFLKLGTEKAKLELVKMEKENGLLEAKTQAIKSAEETEQRYSEAIRAMQMYAGKGDDYE